MKCLRSFSAHFLVLVMDGYQPGQQTSRGGRLQKDIYRARATTRGNPKKPNWSSDHARKGRNPSVELSVGISVSQ